MYKLYMYTPSQVTHIITAFLVHNRSLALVLLAKQTCEYTH